MTWTCWALLEYWKGKLGKCILNIWCISQCCVFTSIIFASLLLQQAKTQWIPQSLSHKLNIVRKSSLLNIWLETVKTMSSNRAPEIFFADEEVASDKLSRKAKESPFMIVGKNCDQKVMENLWSIYLGKVTEVIVISWDQKRQPTVIKTLEWASESDDISRQVFVKWYSRKNCEIIEQLKDIN